MAVCVLDLLRSLEGHSVAFKLALAHCFKRFSFLFFFLLVHSAKAAVVGRHSWEQLGGVVSLERTRKRQSQSHEQHGIVFRPQLLAPKKMGWGRETRGKNKQRLRKLDLSDTSLPERIRSTTHRRLVRAN